MAVVEVELSEYDMLRDAKKKAEDEVKELKQEIEEYKKNARVIVTTKKCFRMIDTHKVAEIASENFLRYQAHYTGIIDPYQSFHETVEERLARKDKENERSLRCAIDEAIRICDTPDCYTPLNSSLDMTESSTEIKGFEDVRLKVEETLKKEFQNEIDTQLMKAKNARQEYEEKKERLEADLRKHFEDEYQANTQHLQDELDKLKCQKRKDDETIKKSLLKINELNTEIKWLNTEGNDTEKIKNENESLRTSNKSLTLENNRLQKDINSYKETIEQLNGKKKKHWWN